jgi:hypothetical protein
VRARDNPFRVERVLRFRYRFAQGGWDALLARLAALSRRGAIVGEEGSGKTTLLEDLALRLESQGYRIRWVTVSPPRRRLSTDQRRILMDGVGPEDLLFLDGADSLSRPAWLGVRRASRRAGGLLVAVHREGLLPTLHRTSTSPRLLSDMVRALSGCGSESFGASAEELYLRHGGNLRTALRELYDTCAARPDSTG